MSERDGIPDNYTDAKKSRQDYPLFGYIYNSDGYYDAPVQLNSATQLDNFMAFFGLPAIRNKQEVRITDTDDCLVFWAQNGKVKWPKGLLV